MSARRAEKSAVQGMPFTCALIGFARARRPRRAARAWLFAERRRHNQTQRQGLGSWAQRAQLLQTDPVSYAVG
jgi:hypothetical protein